LTLVVWKVALLGMILAVLKVAKMVAYWVALTAEL